MPAADAAKADLLALPAPGESVVRQLAGDGVDRYRVTASRDGELWLAVDQDGIDLAVSVSGPGGRDGAAVDGPTGLWGEEWLLVPVRASVTYEVEVRALVPGGAPGRYRLGVESRPPAGSRDGPEREAERAASEAGRLYHQGTRETRERALDLYLQAHGAWLGAGRRQEAAQALFAAAVLLRELDRPQEGLPRLFEAVETWQGLGDRRSEAQALVEVASTMHRVGRDGEVVTETLRRALTLWREVGDLQGQAQTLNYLGLVQVRTAPREAVAPYGEALDLFRRLGDLVGEGAALNNLGGVHDLLGEPHPALERFGQALEIYRRLGNRGQEAALWNNVASVRRRTGRLQDALDGYREALAIRRELGDRRGEAVVLNNLGLVWLALGDAPRARDALEEALPLRRATEDRRGEATTLHNLALVEGEAGDWERAVALWNLALAVRHALGDRAGEATALIGLGRAEGRLGRTGSARRHLDAALASLAEAGNAWREAQARWVLGEVLTDAGESAAARTELERAVELYRATGDDLGRGEALLALARAGRGEPERALAHATAALDLLETVRAAVDSPGLRSSFLARHDEAFELAIVLAMALDRRHPAGGWSARALELSERSRARSLLDRLQAIGAAPREGADAALLESRREVLERLSAQVARRRHLLETAGPSAATEGLGAEIRATEARLDEVSEAIRRGRPGREGLTHPRPIAAPAIQALLDESTTLLEYSLGERRSYLWAVTPRRIDAFELPGRAALDAAAREVYEAFRVNEPGAGRAGLDAAARLSATLLGPVAGRLAGQWAGQRLAIVADGALQYVPFGALPDPAAPGEPLLAGHEIVVLPSASALAAGRRALAGRAPAPRTLAVLADPVLGPGDPRLPSRPMGAGRPGTASSAATGAGRAPAYGGAAAGALGLGRLAWSGWEAEAVARRAGAAEASVDLGFDAHLEAVRGGRLAGHRIVHFATHGVVDSERPELTALVLSLYDREGRPRDGLLRLPEIYDLELDADLVVLSGCETALGREIRGEGLVGLGRGFLAAGARSVVASHWRVQDRAAAELMDLFYRHLLDGPGPLRPAAALRAAQLDLRRRPGFAAPYFWAPFAAYGDWR